MDKIIIDNHEYPYIIEYKRIKNIYFRVKDDLVVHVSAPKIVSKSYIEKLLMKNDKLVIKMYQSELQKRERKQDIYYLGNKLDLIISEGDTYINNDCIYAKDIETAQKYIYSLAYDVFKVRVDSIKTCFNDIPDFKLKVRKMTSKWGVCNIKSMSVTLNTELITKDVHLIDYVIVHELSHFKHMNHSAAFWCEVSKHYPYYKKARKELNY